MGALVKPVSEIRAEGVRLLRSGMTVAAVCEQLGVPEGTVRSWASRAGISLTAIRNPTKVKKVRNVTPAPYHRGCVWGAGE